MNRIYWTRLKNAEKDGESKIWDVKGDVIVSKAAAAPSGYESGPMCAQHLVASGLMRFNGRGSRPPPTAMERDQCVHSNWWHVTSLLM